MANPPSHTRVRAYQVYVTAVELIAPSVAYQVYVTAVELIAPPVRTIQHHVKHVDVPVACASFTEMTKQSLRLPRRATTLLDPFGATCGPSRLGDEPVRI